MKTKNAQAGVNSRTAPFVSSIFSVNFTHISLRNRLISRFFTPFHVNEENFLARPQTHSVYIKTHSCGVFSVLLSFRILPASEGFATLGIWYLDIRGRFSSGVLCLRLCRAVSIRGFSRRLGYVIIIRYLSDNIASKKHRKLLPTRNSRRILKEVSKTNYHISSDRFPSSVALASTCFHIFHTSRNRPSTRRRKIVFLPTGN
jgi:hypothetical protein